MCTFSLVSVAPGSAITTVHRYLLEGNFLGEHSPVETCVTETLLLLPCSLARLVATLEMSGFPTLHRLTTLGDQCRGMA